MKVADLFCCGGGFSLGFDYLDRDFTLVYALDNWKTACQTYHSNFPYVDVDCRDALTIKPSEIPTVDVLIGSPPCQEFTSARALGFNKRSFDTSLIEWFLSVVKYMQPTYWIMENVPIVRNYIPTTVPIIKVIRMSDYSVPQLRKQMFAGVLEKEK